MQSNKLYILFAALLIITGCSQENNIFTDKEGHKYQAIPTDNNSPKQIEENKVLKPVINIDDGSYWRISKDGKLKFESVFFDNGHDYYVKGLARFIRNGKVGFHDKLGNVIIEPKYDYAGPFPEDKDNNFAFICNGCWAEYPENPKYAAVSSKGCQFPLKEQYKGIQGGKWGAINTKGEEIVPVTHKSSESVLKLLKHK